MDYSRMYYIRVFREFPAVPVPTSHSFAEHYDALAALYRERCSKNSDLDTTLHKVIGDWSKGFHDWEW